MTIYRQRRTGHGSFRGRHRHRLTRGALSLDHLIISLIIAGVFIVGADRSPILCRYAIAGSLLYGFGVFIVMHLIVTPLSATPPLPAPTTPWLIEGILEHILLIGLPLGILVQRHADINQ